MPKPLSNDLRKRVIEYSNEGLMQRKIAEMLKVSNSFVSRLLSRYKETKNIKPKVPQITRPRFVNYEKIAEYIKNNPDKTQKEIGKEFGYKEKAVCYIIKKLNITYKKKTFIRGKR